MGTDQNSKPLQMLVVEDDVMYASLLERYLGGLADEINIVRSWEEADRFVEKSRIMWLDLVVEPWDDDYGFLKIGEYRQRNKKAVIFVVSGRADDDAQQRSLQAGADAFSEKLDAGSQNQVIAVMISALLKAQERGFEGSIKFLEKARLLLRERISPQQS